VAGRGITNLKGRVRRRPEDARKRVLKLVQALNSLIREDKAKRIFALRKLISKVCMFKRL
jgi:hypothetical protein